MWKGCIILSCTLAALLVVSWFVLEWTDDGTDDYPGGVVLRDRAGEVLRVSLGEGDCDSRPYYTADADDWIVKAIVAVEDGSYWTHHGVRPLSILRAFFQNVCYRRRISGASTLTMQAVRLIRPHPKTYWWKYKEAFLALKLERKHDKRWILSQYLNRAPFGSNFIGIESAASGWFGKRAKDLGIAEAAMLAGMVQAPSRFRPDRGYDRAIHRREYVLRRMRELGMITAAEERTANAIRPVVCRLPRPFKAPYFCDWYLSAHWGRNRDIVTSLDPEHQQSAEQAVNAASAAHGYSVAAIIAKVDTGEVTALACSGNYFDHAGGQVNTALAPRPAGSTLKPFLAALALDAGLVTPEERLLDVAKTFKGYRPANFDAETRGRVTLGDSLVLSLNLPFVRLLNRVGVTRFADTLRSLGFAHIASPEELGLGLAIGNAEVSLMELVQAYRQLACRGGEVFSPEAAYLVSDILSGEERAAAAFGHVADVALPRFAWKTGTSAAYRDAWTILWNPEYVVGVWCGHKSGGFGDRSLVGAKAAAPLAWSLARTLYPQNTGPWFVEPSGVVRQKLCALTGLPASGSCPETEEGRAIKDVSSPHPCEVHRLDLNARPVVCARAEFTILKPADGEKFEIVENVAQQKILCTSTYNTGTRHLWWFVDGALKGETIGEEPFVLDPNLPNLSPHTITAATASGETCSVTIQIANTLKTSP